MAFLNENYQLIASIIEESITRKLPVSTLCREKGHSDRLVRDKINSLRSKKNRTEEEQRLVDYYDDYLFQKEGWSGVGPVEKSNPNEVKEKPIDFDDLSKEEKEEFEYDAYKDDKYDERSSGESLRENPSDVFVEHNTGMKIPRITGYKYRILIRDEQPLVGYFTREEMDMVYRLYSSLDGAGLTLRTVSRHFPGLTFRDFKRILRAFNITKQSIPIAPHVLEELHQDKIIEIIFRNKENNLLKKIELDRGRAVEKLLHETQKELIELRHRKNDLMEVISKLELGDITPFHIEQKPVNSEKALLVYLSDQHVGAYTVENSIYQNKYDEKEFSDRMNKTVMKIHDYYKIYGRFDKIIVCNLGDALDGYNGQTTRGGHHLPQNMNNKEQFNTYINVTLKFFETLHDLDMANNIEYYSVGDDNHSGDFGYIANKALEHIFGIKYPDMKIRVFEKFIEHFDYGVHTFILTHGKDKEDKKHGFPLVLDEKTQNYFNEYIDIMKVRNPHVHIVVGDLHQTLTQYGKRFRWRRVLSMYGSSKWIHTNFGHSRAGVEFEIVDKTNESVKEERLWF
jgi:hypothetical protein